MQHGDSIGDPPIITTLLVPLEQVRASLGPAMVPDDSLLWALRTTATRAADTDLEHSAGLRTLMSGWSTTSGDGAMAVLHTTREEIGSLADRSPQYAALLQDAYTTNAEAAAKVDRIIAQFRHDARGVASAAQTTADSDRITALATSALDDALAVVESARTRMQGYTQRAAAMQNAAPVNIPGAVEIAEPYSDHVTEPAAAWGAPSTTTAGWGAPSARVNTPGVGTPGVSPAPQVDPMVLVQAQLQSQLIAAGVKLGGSLIDAGVKLGTSVIDKGATLVGKAIDAAAKTADTAIKEGALKLPNPTATPAPAPGTALPSGPGTPTIDFGASSPPNVDQPSPTEPAPATPAVVPHTPVIPPASAVPAKPAPPAMAPPAPPASAMPVPPATPPSDQEHKRRSGQLGVTVPVPPSENNVIAPPPPQP
ncbi:hypothetical protein [Nocardia brasiliensis]|uniref:hypothetical protein n=1 Tax=Nocardia brasiliensis TaxID=37326 RepID=UPI001895643D|nr:hypothetical protein [Nocardia brasiliensis]MBF6126589.1 hypothetical protein [Nocardia brasiliensis]